jgi:hypothetical protein
VAHEVTLIGAVLLAAFAGFALYVAIDTARLLWDEIKEWSNEVP